MQPRVSLQICGGQLERQSQEGNQSPKVAVKFSKNGKSEAYIRSGRIIWLYGILLLPLWEIYDLLLVLWEGTLNLRSDLDKGGALMSSAPSYLSRMPLHFLGPHSHLLLGQTTLLHVPPDLITASAWKAVPHLLHLTDSQSFRVFVKLCSISKAPLAFCRGFCQRELLSMFLLRIYMSLSLTIHRGPQRLTVLFSFIFGSLPLTALLDTSLVLDVRCSHEQIKYSLF